jgi:uncharacterized protein with HEPN domain
MRRAASRILEYTAELDRDGFRGRQIVIDAVLRNFEILGEAASRVSVDVRDMASDIDWQRIKDFRNVVAHVYSGVDLDLTWVLIQQRIPALLRSLDALRRQIPDG